MIEFPKLRTGAQVHYPVRREFRYRTQVVRFLDGSEQRFRETAQAAHRWVVNLDLLSEGEISDIADFVDSLAGTSGTFSFTDPEDGTVYPSCRLENEVFTSVHREENQASTKLVFAEVVD